MPHAAAPASIVIPAHNEELVIGRCLDALVSEGVAGCEVVVVANGCDDATAEIARGYQDLIPGIRVLEVPAAGKPGALNQGDAVVSAFPRIYLDADIELVDGALGSLIHLLSGDVDAVAAPHIHFDTRGSSVVPRAFYDVYARLPYVRRGLVGLGVYALSERGRSRFGEFPDVIADDLFVQQLFAESDRLTSEGRFVVRGPRRTRELVRVRARGADGTRQVAELGLSARSLDDERGSSVAGLVRLGATKPWLLPQILVYVGVTVAGRRLGERESGVWQRDDSTRTRVTETRDLRIAYLVSPYPKLSHTFIEREVLGLRALGAEVRTFSVRPPDPDEVRDEAGEAEARSTPVLLGDLSTAARRAGSVLLRRPGCALRLVALALRTGQPTPRARVWQLFYALEALVLFSHLRPLGIRHVHVHLANNAADVARLVVELGRSVDGPEAGWRWSMTMHGPTEFEAVEQFDLAAKVVSASGVACISDFTRSQLMRLVPSEEWHKLRVVRMSVDLDRYPYRPRIDRDGPFRVLFVGRLVAEKGVIVLLEALEELVSRGVEAELRVVGGGGMAEAMAHRVRQRGLETVVTLLGPLAQSDVAREFARADVFCLPSFQEGLPVVLMEAMAAGLPVVTTSVNGVPELVENRVSGRLVTPGRPDLVAAALADVAGDSNSSYQMAQEGRRRVEEEFAGPITARAQLAFLRGLTSRPNRSVESPIALGTTSILRRWFSRTVKT